MPPRNPDCSIPPLRGGRLSRRAFFASAGALSIGVVFGAWPEVAQAGGGSGLGAWVSIGPDGIVTIQFALAEMGQGIMTTLPLLIAEEMDADWNMVRVVQSPSNGAIFGTEGAIGTFGSTSTHANYLPMRLIGARARRILVMTAARSWGVPEGELSIALGRVTHADTGRSIGFGALAQIVTIPDPLPHIVAADLKSPSAFRYIGKTLPRVDIPSKVDGSAVFGIDTQLPGLLFGAILRPMVQGEVAEEIDDAAAKAMPGIRQIVPLPGGVGVGVIGDSIEATQLAKTALRVRWSAKAPARGYSSAGVMSDYRAVVQGDGKGVIMHAFGDAQAAIAGATRTIVSDYTSDHVAHLCMEPMNATVLAEPDRVQVWVSTQAPTAIKEAVALLAGLDQDAVAVHSTLIGGGFGRRYETDYATDAYLLARAVPGRPVKLIYSREDDVRQDPYRPLVAQRITVGLDAAGGIAGWRHRIAGESYFARKAPALLKKFGGQDPLVASGGELSYAAGAQLVEYLRQDRGVAVGALRGIASGYTRFAVESMIDEIAQARAMDPLALRLSLLKASPRAVAVLDAVAELAGWSIKRQGRGLGLAYSDDLSSHLAVIVEISLDADTGTIVVHGIWCAFDAGMVVQPINLAAQLEGSLLFGMSVALYEQLNIVRGEADESNFGEYRVLRMSDCPDVKLRMIVTDNLPGGVGEAGVPAIAPAIANAFAQLTGRRMRDLPMRPDRVRSVLSAAAS